MKNMYNFNIKILKYLTINKFILQIYFETFYEYTLKYNLMF